MKAALIGIFWMNPWSSLVAQPQAKVVKLAASK